MTRPRCAGLATATFDPWFDPDPQQQAWAKALCAGCEVRAACGAGAVERDEQAGIWAGVDRGVVGMAEPDWAAAAVEVPRHGSRTAYLHCTGGDEGGKCAACRGANAAYQSHYRHDGPAVTRPAIVDLQMPLFEGVSA